MNRKSSSAIPTGVAQTYLGKMTTYVRNGVEIMRGSGTTSFHDRKSLPQIYQRLRMNNLNAFAKKVSPFLKNCWEQQEAGRGRYYYQNFVRANKNARAYGVVINANHDGDGVLIADYQISQGTLPTIVVDTNCEGTERGITDIAVGELEINENTTIGEISRALVENNGMRFRYYDRLTFFYMTQLVEGGKPTARCGLVSIVLAEDSQETMEGLNLRGFGVNRNRLAIRSNMPIGGYTWIHQRAVPKTTKMLCSTQTLTMSDSAALNAYASTESMREAAIQMGATIPQQASMVKPEHREVYEAFGVPCSPIKNYGVRGVWNEEAIVQQVEE